MVSARDFPRDDARWVLFGGRSNAGKSTVLNLLCGNRKLARVSKTPGCTAAANFFSLSQGGYFVDLPGYGYAATAKVRSRNFEPLIRELLASGYVALFVLCCDIRRELREEEREFLGWFAKGEGENLLLLTKADKVARSAIPGIMRRREAQSPAGTEVIAISARTGYGVEELRRRIYRVLKGE